MKMYVRIYLFVTTVSESSVTIGYGLLGSYRVIFITILSDPFSFCGGLTSTTTPYSPFLACCGCEMMTSTPIQGCVVRLIGSLRLTQSPGFFKSASNAPRLSELTNMSACFKELFSYFFLKGIQYTTQKALPSPRIAEHLTHYLVSGKRWSQCCF